MPQTTVQADLYCYGALVASGQWTGVKLSDLLNQVDADLNARSIIFTAKDGYTMTISIETAMRPDVIMAFEKDESQLIETYRLVIPLANGNMWIAMITYITLSDGGADNVVSAATGPIIKMNQNQFTQNTDNISQNAQHIIPSPKPNMPIQSPSNTATSLPTNSPANISISPIKRTDTSPIITINAIYVALTAVLVSIILLPLIIKHNKSVKF